MNKTDFCSETKHSVDFSGSDSLSQVQYLKPIKTASNDRRQQHKITTVNSSSNKKSEVYLLF